MNVGLLVLAPSTTTMREEHPFMIALEADNRVLMPIVAIAGFGGDSSVTKMQSSHVVSLLTGEMPADIRFRDQDSSKNMFSLPWEGDE